MSIPPRAKPLPIPTPETAPYWEAAQRRQLMIQRCDDCGTPYFYPRDHCPSCQSASVSWFAASGRATLHTYLISHLPAEGFEGELPYVIAIVELAEGPRMLTNLVGVAADPEALPLDLPLQVEFQDRGNWLVPVFRPAGAA